MARSVSYATGASWVLYAIPDHGDDEEMDELDWDDFIGNLRAEFKAAFPSLDDTDEWLDREDHAILENRFAYIGVSEYMGLASVWGVARTNDYGGFETEALAENWLNQIRPKAEHLLDRFSTRLAKMGTFSNGESVYMEAIP